MAVTCRNYRPNINNVQLPDACWPHQGQVFADLHDEDGKFIRTAVVAECGDRASAERYCRERETKSQANT